MNATAHINGRTAVVEPRRETDEEKIHRFAREAFLHHHLHPHLTSAAISAGLMDCAWDRTPLGNRLLAEKKP